MIKNKMLDENQQNVINHCKKGKNVFVTGPGGTGKSFLINKLLKYFIDNGKKIAVCALTGVSAELLGCNAKTIHSWSGTGILKGKLEKIIDNIYKREKDKTWLSTDVLIVDEVSMMNKKLFESLDKIGRTIRKINKPFGGIQLIFLGDFYQLPPVGDNHDMDTYKFCFESVLWKKTFHKKIVLTKIYRQKDKIFSKILNSVRKGVISHEDFDILSKRINKKCDKDIPIIAPKKRYVNRVNKDRLDSLKGDILSYEFSYVHTEDYNYDIDPEIERCAKNSLLADINQIIHLKIGAKVMCTCNLITEGEHQIVNGSQGIVTGLNGELPIVSFNNGLTQTMDYQLTMSDEVEGLGIKQIPLMLSWAITIHKSQGITLDSAIIDIGSGIFKAGQAYVALSRVKCLKGLFLKDIDAQKIWANKKVKEFYENINEDSESEEEYTREEWSREEQEESDEPQEESQNESQNESQDESQKKQDKKNKFFKEFNIEKIPEDISELYDNYDKSIYRKLILKYHPDKSDFHDGYIKSLNQIKDNYEPNIHENDETWTK
jgi:ATP-dependent DNA helicase PIF1